MLDGNFEPEDSPLSAYIDRPPPLPWNIEHELREACKAIVRDTGNEEKESTGNEWFNFSNPSKTAKGPSKAKTGKPENNDARKATEAPATAKAVSNKQDLDHEQDKATRKSSAAPGDETTAKSKPVEQPALEEIVNTHDKEPATVTPPNMTSSRKSSLFGKPFHLEPLDTSSISFDRPKTAPSHSSHTSESGIVSASTDQHPLSALTEITTPGTSPVMKSLSTSLQPISTTITTRLSQEEDVQEDAQVETEAEAEAEAAQESTKSSLERPLHQQRSGIRKTSTVESSQLPEPTKESFATSLRNFVRSRSRSMSRTRDEQETTQTTKRQSIGGTLRSLSIRKNKSMGNLLSRSHSHANLDLPTIEDAPPVPKLEPVKKVERKPPVHIASLAKPQQATLPVTSISLQAAKASIVEVQGRSPRNMSKTDVRLATLEAPPRKQSLAASSVDSCFTPPAPHTPDRQKVPLLPPTALPSQMNGGNVGHIDVLKAARSLDSIRAHQQMQQLQSQNFVAESPLSSMPRPNIRAGSPMRNGSAFAAHHESPRPSSRGTIRSAASAHSSRSASHAGISISNLPLPPMGAKYSIMPSTSSIPHSRNHSQPSGLRKPVYAQSVPSGMSTSASSVVYLPSQGLGRSSTAGESSPAVAQRRFPVSSQTKLDLPASAAAAGHANNAEDDRRQTVTKSILVNGADRIYGNASHAASSTTINFSRKIQNDEAAKRESIMTNLDVTALPVLPPSNIPKGPVGRLRKVLSSLTLKKPMRRM
jgi:hypothetical protein